MTKMSKEEFGRTIEKIRKLYNKTGNKGFVIDGIYYCHNYGFSIPDDFIAIVVKCLVDYREKTYNAHGELEILRKPSYNKDKKTTLDKCFDVNHKKMEMVYNDKPDYVEMINNIRVIFGLNIKQAAHVIWKETNNAIWKNKEDTIYQEYVRECRESEFNKYLIKYGNRIGNESLQYYLEMYSPEIRPYIKRHQTVYPK